MMGRAGLRATFLALCLVLGVLLAGCGNRQTRVVVRRSALDRLARAAARRRGSPCNSPSGRWNRTRRRGRAATRGAVPHELKIIRTDLKEDQLPLNAGQVDESKVPVLARSGEIAAGTSAVVRARMERASYVLICNLPGHYAAGMRTAFAVD